MSIHTALVKARDRAIALGDRSKYPGGKYPSEQDAAARGPAVLDRDAENRRLQWIEAMIAIKVSGDSHVHVHRGDDPLAVAHSAASEIYGGNPGNSPKDTSELHEVASDAHAAAAEEYAAVGHQVLAGHHAVAAAAHEKARSAWAGVPDDPNRRFGVDHPAHKATAKASKASETALGKKL